MSRINRLCAARFSLQIHLRERHLKKLRKSKSVKVYEIDRRKEIPISVNTIIYKKLKRYLKLQ